MGRNKIILGDEVLLDLSGDTVTPGALLNGYKAHDKSGSVIQGTMPDNGAVSPSDLEAGGSYTIPKGYHNGAGVVKAKSLASQTGGTAAEAEILDGETAWVNGEKVTGTMPDNGAATPSALLAGGSYTIPKGYHNGSGKVTAKTLAEQTDGTATAGDILSGKTAYVDGSKVTGSMTDQGTKTATLDTSTPSYTIPAGKHSGSGKVSITTQEKSVTPSTSAQTVTPDSGKVLSKVSVGAVPSATQATPSISVDSAGKITASATQEAGYVAAGTKSATKQLTTKGATTITPSSSVQTAVSAGTYCTGDIKVAAATGGVANSGTYTPTSFSKSITINTGKTISSTAKFALFYDDSRYDHYYWDLSTSNTICALVKDGSTVLAVMPESGYESGVGDYGIASTTSDVTVTYSGTKVIITPKYDYYFVPRKFKWYVFT